MNRLDRLLKVCSGAFWKVAAHAHHGRIHLGHEEAGTVWSGAHHQAAARLAAVDRPVTVVAIGVTCSLCRPLQYQVRFCYAAMWATFQHELGFHLQDCHVSLDMAQCVGWDSLTALQRSLAQMCQSAIWVSRTLGATHLRRKSPRLANSNRRQSTTRPRSTPTAPPHPKPPPTSPSPPQTPPPHHTNSAPAHSHPSHAGCHRDSPSAR